MITEYPLDRAPAAAARPDGPSLPAAGERGDDLGQGRAVAVANSAPVASRAPFGGGSRRQ
jgi:hypothetical protein